MFGFKKLVLLTLILFVFILDNAFGKLTDQEYRVLFQQARSHINDSDLSRYYQLKLKLKAYSLYPYLRYLEIINHFDDIGIEKVEAYIRENQDSFWGALLMPQWLNYLGSNEIWDVYLKYGKSSSTRERKCWYAEALYKEQSKDLGLKAFNSIWLYGRSLPDACNFILSKWQGSKYDTKLMRMKRIKLAMQSKQYDLARYLSYKLDKKNQSFIQAWVNAELSPQHSIVVFMSKYKNYKHFEYALDEAFDHYTERDVLSAVKTFEQNQDKIPTDIRGKVVANIAMELARIHRPEAMLWLDKVPTQYATSLTWQWRARTAIRNLEFTKLVSWINQMPDELKSKSQWQYWLAVGLYHTNNKKQSTMIWEKLAKERDYYGFLSADQINQPYNLKTETNKVSEKLVKEIYQDPKIQQIYQLYQLGELQLANYYWRWELKKFERDKALAAAEVANRWNIASMSIYAYNQAGYFEDLIHRFPLAYKSDILRYTNKYKINPGWVWALTRQESHFNPKATSGVGARGLMQLMPSTADYIASKYNIPYSDSSELYKPKINLELGIANLSHVYQQFNESVVVATAAYNAGYGNAKSWLPEHRLKASYWIETVPFLETRTYLRRVLTYSIIYENLQLGKDIKIKDLMSSIQR
ncbi:transglycosylase SLT domain-containing protein [Thiotrichales bacterium 19S9-12]|nr:transglycosylase SLT domain-containing protein [Thiotrichales bacterium 19S9-11]MCF6811948.1 transglycosylase SLT domain-containing protein [Thiotrichales bacterium 19S9-12]